MDPAVIFFRDGTINWFLYGVFEKVREIDMSFHKSLILFSYFVHFQLIAFEFFTLGA